MRRWEARGKRIGVAVVTYLALVLYQSGRTKRDGSMSPRVEQFGSIATGMPGAWFAFFILVGLYTTFFLKELRSHAPMQRADDGCAASIF